MRSIPIGKARARCVNRILESLRRGFEVGDVDTMGIDMTWLDVPLSIDNQEKG
jgi:hypothetical protein